MLVEKCPRNSLRVPFLRSVFPEARLIHIIRDGRDVACSLMPGVGGNRWYHLKPPNWQELFERHAGVTRCALLWKSVVELSMEDLRGVPHLEVRYEDLVRRPVETASACMRYLGLDEDPAVLEFAGRIQDSTADSYQATGQVRWCRDDHRTRVGRWRENMQRAEQAEVNERLGPLLERLGYA